MPDSSLRRGTRWAPARPLARAGVLLSLALIGACTPYALHTTARPITPGTQTATTVVSLVPNGAQLDSARAVSMPGVEQDWRLGLDDRSDIGLRINSFSGGIVTWRRLVDGSRLEPGPATAIILGGGLVNLFQHAHLEASLVTSGSEYATVVPYGGLRVIQVLPLSESAAHDTPTAGAFGGVQFPFTAFHLGVELGVFYDRSTLGLRRGDLVIVPSVSFRPPSRNRPGRGRASTAKRTGT